MSETTAREPVVRVRMMDHPETGVPVRLTEILMELEDLDEPGQIEKQWVVSAYE